MESPAEFFWIPSNVFGQFHLLLKKNIFGETVTALFSTPVCNEYSLLTAKLSYHVLDDALAG